jgi:MFS family permease
MSIPTPISAAPPLSEKPARGRPRGLAALGFRAFRWFWVASLFFQLAMNMGMVGSGWLVYRLTGSAVALAGTWTLSGISLVVLPFFGGVVADRISKRWLISLSQAAILLGNLATVALLTLGALQYWHLLAMSLVGGVSWALNLPARQAIIPELVPVRHLGNAVALNVAVFNVTKVLGPAVAGILVGWVGLEGLYWASILCYLVAVISIVTLPVAGQGAPAAVRVGQDLARGFRYLRARPVLLGLIGMAVTVSTFGMFYQLLMPVFAADVLRVGPEGLGMLLGAAGAGAVAGSVGLAWLGERGDGRLFVATGLLYGACLAAFAAAGQFPLALAFLFLAGLCNGVFIALNNALLLANCEPEMRGRLMGLYYSANGFMPLTAVAIGGLAAWIGAPWTVGLGGVLVVLLIGAQAALQPTVRQLRA